MASNQMVLFGDNYQPRLLVRSREDGNDSRSGSEHLDPTSGDDQDADEQPPRKKKYHRHTPHQIQELEAECPHPDEKQRRELGRRLGLENRQIKFWFQNRRTQLKNQIEKHENLVLRQENEKLRAENILMKDAMKNPICNNCGGPAMLAEISFDEHDLKIENARLKEDVNRFRTLAEKFLGRPLSSLLLSNMDDLNPNAGLDLTVGTNVFPGSSSDQGNVPPMLLNSGDGVSSNVRAPSRAMGGMGIGVLGNAIGFDGSMLIDLALTAMDQLVKMVQPDSTLWNKEIEGGKEILNLEEYARVFPPCIGVKPTGFVTEATREAGVVIINSSALADTMMDPTRWAEMFTSCVAKASTLEVISAGMGDSRNGALQLMQAELRVLSPLVPVRPMTFIRFCKQHAEGVWAVVDVSIDPFRDTSSQEGFMSFRRLPSGFVSQDLPNGYSMVTWVEHSEYDESIVHHLYHPFISSGMGFGAGRWVATLKRQCESLALLMSSIVPGEDPTAALSPSGRRSMLKLAQRMMDRFCCGICASSARNWKKLHVVSLTPDMQMMTRKNIDDPSEPPGIVLSAATSVWLPVTQKQLFDLLRDLKSRCQWDILSNPGEMEEMLHITKGERQENCIKLLRGGPIREGESDVLILQETWSDESASVVVYAPVDMPSVDVVINGGDSEGVALLPSGFVIHPNAAFDCVMNNSDGNLVSGDQGAHEGDECLLTVGFQILVSGLPSAKLTVGSVETVNNLITCTIQKIKAALQVA